MPAGCSFRRPGQSLFARYSESWRAVLTASLRSAFLLWVLWLPSQSPAQINVSPSSLDFGNVSIGLSASKFLRITSSVSLRATISASPPFSVPSGSLRLSDLETLVPVTFAPARVGPFTGNVRISVSELTVQVPVRGVGIPATAANTPNAGTIGDPVSSATGEVYEETVDSTLGGALPLRFMRYYASFLKSSGVSSALGDNWMHNFDARLALDGASATVTLFRGKRFRFTRVDGVWELNSPRRLSYQLVLQGGEYLFLDARENLIYAFSLAGRLLRIEDRNGNALTLDSSSELGPAQVSDSLGRSLTFTYADDKLTLVQDQTGRSVLFNHTGDELTSATDANGGVTTYEYTTRGERTALLTAKTLPAGNTPFTQEFDDEGRVIRQGDSRGNPTSIDYDTPTTGTTTITDPLSNSSLHRHVNVAQLATYTDPAGERSLRNYDAENRLTLSRDRLDDSIRVTYHQPSGRQASSTDALGNATTYSYQEQTQGAFTFFNLTRIDYADGASLSATHDARGNVLTLTDQDGRVRAFTYNVRGQQLTETNPAAGQTRFSYNADGTLASARPPSGEMTAFSYDEEKRLSMITNPDGTTRTFAYDDNDNLLNQTDERGGAGGASYDQNNQLTSLTDAEDNTVSLEYDDDQRTSRFIDPSGAATPLEYDEAGRISRVTAPTGEVVAFTFDALNRLTSLADCEGHGLDFTYDAEGVLSSVADGVGRTWSLASDKRGRITRITSPLGRNFDFTYDRRNRRSSFSNPLAEVTAYTRDARGLLTGVMLPGDVSASFERNELGRVSGITDPGGNLWSRSYDAQGRLTSTTDPLGRVAAYEYDSRDRVAGITFPEGEVTFTYDEAGEVTRAAYSDSLELAVQLRQSRPARRGEWPRAGLRRVGRGHRIQRRDHRSGRRPSGRGGYIRPGQDGQLRVRLSGSAQHDYRLAGRSYEVCPRWRPAIGCGRAAERRSDRV